MDNRLLLQLRFTNSNRKMIHRRMETQIGPYILCIRASSFSHSTATIIGHFRQEELTRDCWTVEKNVSHPRISILAKRKETEGVDDVTTLVCVALTGASVM